MLNSQPRHPMNSFCKLASCCFLLAFLLPAIAAAEGGEKGGGKDASLFKMEYILTNLQGEGRRYIQVDTVLRLTHPAEAERVKKFMPAIRHQMILLLSGKSDLQLAPIEAKIKLLQESKDAINKVLNTGKKDVVSQVLFTSFIIQ